LKLTKNLKRIIATSFLQERISIKSLAELYGLSVAQIENVIREAILDQRARAEFAERELRHARDENARLIHQAQGEPLRGL
jgi:replication initiation and membrane attachment protein DnaB